MTDKLTKSDLVNEIALETGLTKVAVEKTLAALQNTVIDSVSAGKRVTLAGFVSFAPVKRNARKMMNPRTREVMDVPERKAVKTNVLKAFADRVAKGK